MREKESFQRSIGLAESVLEYLRRHELPATPSQFEFWYAYAAGTNPKLRRAVNEAVAARGQLTPDEVQRLQRQHLTQRSSADEVDEIGGEIASGISDMARVIDGILQDAAAYSAELATILSRLDGGNLPTSQVLDFLADASHRLEDGRRSLEEQLREACSGFDTLRSSLESVRLGQLNDPLTTLATRKHFDTAIGRAVEEAAADGTELALILTDIDHFKSFNDRYGHQTGDQVLRMVAQSTKQNIKGQDTACRYGGEEFAIILPLTDEESATVVAEHIRQAVMLRNLVKWSTGETIGHVTLSAGIAAYRPGDTPQSLIERTDACLYGAKRAGRNCVMPESGLRDVA